MQIKPENIIDRLGEIRAEIAELREREEMLIEALLDSGVDSADGRYFRAIIIKCTVETFDYKGIVEKLAPSTRLLKRFTRQTERTQVRISPLLSIVGKE